MNPLARWGCVSVAVVSFTVFGGCRKRPQIRLTCEATPPVVYPGQIVVLSASANFEDEGRDVNCLYNWSGDGVIGTGDMARVVTDSLKPGTYTARAEVKEGRPGKEGRKDGESATCTTEFTVKKNAAPTLSCSADPSTISPGESSRITCTGESSENRPLHFRYSASNGTIVGIGNVGILLVSEDTIGEVTVTSTVEDDENRKASSNTTVSVGRARPAPSIQHVQSLCSIAFGLDKQHPTWISNEALMCLDEVTLELQANPKSKVVMVTNSTAFERRKTFREEQSLAKQKHGKITYFAEQRAVNLKEYLIHEKGLDPYRVAIATGTDDNRAGRAYLVPEGVSFEAEVQGTTWINDSAFEPERQWSTIGDGSGDPACDLLMSKIGTCGARAAEPEK